MNQQGVNNVTARSVRVYNTDSLLPWTQSWKDLQYNPHYIVYKYITSLCNEIGTSLCSGKQQTCILVSVGFKIWSGHSLLWLGVW